MSKEPFDNQKGNFAIRLEIIVSKIAIFTSVLRDYIDHSFPLSIVIYLIITFTMRNKLGFHTINSLSRKLHVFY